MRSGISTRSKISQTHQASENASRAERDRLAGEAKDLQQRLIDNAAKVQDLEAAYAQSEAELDKLNQTAAALQNDLSQNRDRVAHLLAVLQRLDTEEPPALTLRPERSLTAARSAMQMGAMLPPVYQQAAALARQLKTLSETSTKIKQTASLARGQADALEGGPRRFGQTVANPQPGDRRSRGQAFRKPMTSPRRFPQPDRRFEILDRPHLGLTGTVWQ